jgi:hypothetical protein
MRQGDERTHSWRKREDGTRLTLRLPWMPVRANRQAH